MKRLHKKIGVGVLVAGLLLGAGGLSGGSVAHANEKQEQAQKIFKEGLLKGLNDEQKLAVEKLIIRENSNFRGKKFKVIDSRSISDGERSINLVKGSRIDKVMVLRNLNECLEDLRDIVSQSSEKSFVKLILGHENLEILLIVL